MKIAIVGPGALGTFLAGVLGKHNEVVLLGRDELDLSRVHVRGHTEVDSDVDYTTDTSSLTDRDHIILCTKSYDTEQAMKSIHPYIGDDAKVVSLQNGLKNERIISRYVRPDQVIGGVTSNGITYESPGNVIHAGEGDTLMGLYPKGKNKSVIRLADRLIKGGLDVKVVDSIYGYIWQKVIVNACINPISALTGLKNGALLKNEGLYSLMERVCSESYDVAIKETELPSDTPMEEVKRVASLTADNKSSMLQDIERKRKTEIGCINGAIVTVGEKMGADTPLNRTLYSLVKGRELSFQRLESDK